MTLTRALDAYRQEYGARAAAVAREAAGRAPALDDRLSAAGLPDGPDGADELDRVPVLTKDELPALQGRRFGGLVADGAEVVRAFASPGPIYEPQMAGPDPWRWRAALAACGIGADDVVLNCFGYHLSPAGVMFDEACRAVGALVVPAGVGMQEVQARAVADLGVTAYIGLPSYLAALAESYDAAGLPEERWQVRSALVTAEPLPPDLRARLQQRVPRVLMAYGTAEAGLIGHETEPEAGLRPDAGVYVQVCDPDTGDELPAGASGEVVVSVLQPEYPLVRFGTGDVSCWVESSDGPRLAGVLGRVGAAVKVRGMFVHPHQAGGVVDSLRGAGAAAGRFVVERARDEGERFVLEVVPVGGTDVEALEAEAVRRTRDALRVRPEVVVVESLEEGPALVDRRP
jgi:phenylacetate-CoA ligase